MYVYGKIKDIQSVQQRHIAVSGETKKLVSYRLDPELIEALKTRAKSNGKDQTEVVETALKMYLGLPVNTTAFPSPALEERISEIENRLTEVAVLKEKIASLETELGKSVA